MSCTFVFLLYAGRYLPDGDHGYERAVPLFSFCVPEGIYLMVIMEMLNFVPLLCVRVLS